jgi:hypothetical protein
MLGATSASNIINTIIDLINYWLIQADLSFLKNRVAVQRFMIKD